MKKLFRKWAIKQNEEFIMAMQNIGAVLFIVGLFLACMMADVVPMIICFLLSAIGFSIAYFCEITMDEMYKDEFSNL